MCNRRVSCVGSGGDRSGRSWWLFSSVVIVFFEMVSAAGARADLVTFDELSTWTNTTSVGSYYNGSAGGAPNSLGWSSGGVHFGNSYDSFPGFGDFWDGFSYSNVNNPTQPGFGNQYAANVPTGVGGKGNYALVYSGTNAFFNLPQATTLQSIYVTNTAYTMYSMLNGDSFAKRFGGASGNDPDFLSIRFEGYDAVNGTGALTGSVEFFLADYRSADNSLDYVVRDWTQVDLNRLGLASSVRISFSSSDMGVFGINTPTYAALDNLQFSSVPEPSSLLLGTVAIASLTYRACRRFPYRQKGARNETT